MLIAIPQDRHHQTTRGIHCQANVDVVLVDQLALFHIDRGIDCRVLPQRQADRLHHKRKAVSFTLVLAYSAALSLRAAQVPSRRHRQSWSDAESSNAANHIGRDCFPHSRHLLAMNRAPVVPLSTDPPACRLAADFPPASTDRRHNILPKIRPDGTTSLKRATGQPQARGPVSEPLDRLARGRQALSASQLAPRRRWHRGWSRDGAGAAAAPVPRQVLLGRRSRSRGEMLLVLTAAAGVPLQVVPLSCSRISRK
jgi:hypothetical protein